VTPNRLSVPATQLAVSPTSSLGSSSGFEAATSPCNWPTPQQFEFCNRVAFESSETTSLEYLDAIREASPQERNRIDLASLGRRRFIRYWHLDPSERHFYQGWHSYNLPEIAPGYFVHNIVDAINPESVLRNNDVWFPGGGKEAFKDASLWMCQSNRSFSRVINQ